MLHLCLRCPDLVLVAGSTGDVSAGTRLPSASRVPSRRALIGRWRKLFGLARRSDIVCSAASVTLRCIADNGRTTPSSETSFLFSACNLHGIVTMRGTSDELPAFLGLAGINLVSRHFLRAKQGLKKSLTMNYTLTILT